MNLNHPAIDPGPIRAIDLERDINTGRIYHLHRATPMQCPPCHGDCRQGRDCPGPDTIPTDFGAPEGGEFRDPVPSAVYSMRRHDRIRYRVALALLAAVAAYLSHIAWPLVAA